MTAGVGGAGLMGAEIALVFALGGHAVVLNNHDEAALERGTARIATVLRDAYASRGPARPPALRLL